MNSPTGSSTRMEYCLIIPFLSSGSGGSHDNNTDVELSTENVKLVGAPDGTVVKSAMSHKTLSVCFLGALVLPSSSVLTVITVLGGPSPTVTAKMVQLYV